MNKLKVLFGGGSKAGLGALKLLKEKHDSNQIELVGVMKDDRDRWYNSYGWDPQEFARQNDIPLVDSITETEHDVFISVLYWKVLSQADLDSARVDNINFHLAELPKYRGSNVLTHAILNGEKRYGITCHRMIAKLDAGDFWRIGYCDITAADTSFSVYLKISEVTVKLAQEFISQMIAAWAKGEYKAIKFSKQEGESNYYSKDSLGGDFKLIKDIESKESKKKVRALHFPPFEPAYAVENGEKVWLTFEDGTVKVNTKKPWEFF